MSPRVPKIAQAWLESTTHGVIELARDWRARHIPPVSLSGEVRFRHLHRVRDHSYGDRSGYFVTRRGDIYFFLPRQVHPRPYARRDDAVYLAGDFNGWGDAIGRPEWLLRPASLDTESVLVWTGRAERFFATPPLRFKFVTGEGHWFDPPSDAPNLVRDDAGNLNRVIDPDRTGQHLFAFEVETPLDLSRSWQVLWEGDSAQAVVLHPGPFFYELQTDLPLGADVHADHTTFRLFAPRAREVTLWTQPDEAAEPWSFACDRADGMDGAAGVWEVTLDQDLHGWRYWYTLDGPRDAFGLFDPTQRVLDPYALATIDRNGPGLVIDRQRIARAEDPFQTPAWQDLVICEAHVRDLVAHAPVKMTELERRGFTGLRRWVEDPRFYLHELGINCVELQPVHEFDNAVPEEY
ncbi:MAG TPA: glycoside hydrolase family 1, partial [Candidatus Synoicihabitans sp.]|nr:glycoside hydrolase family 1 [Candidatus Synoicihabitans sp.]